MPEIERVKSVALVSRLIVFDDGLRSASTMAGKLRVVMIGNSRDWGKMDLGKGCEQ